MIPGSENLPGTAAFQVEGQDPEEYQDDSAGHDQGVNGQENDLEQRLSPGGVEREKEVGHGLAEEDDQQDDTKGGTVKIF